MLVKIQKDKLTVPKAVIGFWPVNSTNDDLELYTNEKRNNIQEKLFFLRQQMHRKSGRRANYCLADFIAPVESNVKDYLGGFVVTAGKGIEEISKKYEDKKDDYNSILIKSLGDRIAEAFAEKMHEEIRKKYWGYSKKENFDNQDLINEKYFGIRPAPGYPACPDHTEKKTLFRLLNVEKLIGVTLTDSFAMFPTSSVSGFYFSNRKSEYFGIGKINKDQIISYAKRKNISIEDAEKWLAPNLSYLNK